MDAASFYVGQTFGKLGINDRALLRFVLVVRIRELRDDRDHAAGCPEFELLPALETSLPTDGRRNHKRHSVVFLTATVIVIVTGLNATNFHLHDSRYMLAYRYL